MPISATGRMPAKSQSGLAVAGAQIARHRSASRRLHASGEAGFTLIEILVVMTILAIAAGIVAINAPPQRSAVRIAAENFAETIAEIDRLAAINGGTYRIVMTPTGYRFERRVASDWVREPAFSPIAFDDGIFLTPRLVSPVQSNALGLNGERNPSADRLERERFSSPGPGGAVQNGAGPNSAAGAGNGRGPASDQTTGRRGDEPPETFALIDPIGPTTRLDVSFQRGVSIWTVSRALNGIVTIAPGEPTAIDGSAGRSRRGQGGPGAQVPSAGLR